MYINTTIKVTEQIFIKAIDLADFFIIHILHIFIMALYDIINYFTVLIQNSIE